MRIIKRIVAVVVAFAAVLAVAAPASACVQPRFGKVRHATVTFHSVKAAEAAGYEKFLECFDSPGVGGMGQHFANMALLDATIDPLKPEVLVYEPGKRYKLVAVEYVVPQAAWTKATPPKLFGHEYHRNDTLGIWALHLWIWRHNPLGMFADYNPRVHLCS